MPLLQFFSDPCLSPSPTFPPNLVDFLYPFCVWLLRNCGNPEKICLISTCYPLKLTKLVPFSFLELFKKTIFRQIFRPSLVNFSLFWCLVAEKLLETERNYALISAYYHLITMKFVPFLLYYFSRFYCIFRVKYLLEHEELLFVFFT